MNRYLLILCYALAGCGRTAPFTEYTRTLEGTCPMALELDFQGVWTNPNAHSKVPAGAARRAENIVNPRPGVADCVPGQQNLTGTYAVSDERFSSGVVYAGMLVEHTSGAIPRLYRRDPDAGTLTPYATPISPPVDSERVSFAEAGEKLYMATDAGVQFLDGGTAEPVVVATPEPLSVIPNLGPDTLLGGVGESVAYRYVIARHQSDGTYRRSRPSGRATYVAAGTESVNVNLWLPAGLVASDRLEVYRTGISGAGVDPGDTMFLVAQVNPATSILDGTTEAQTIHDTTPDALRGEPLYTNATSEGITRQNERPPLGNVLLAFDDALLVGNVRGTQRFTLRLVGLPDDLDTITIAGVTLTGKLTGFTGPEDYQIQDFYSVSRNIEETARNLVQAINRRIFPGITPRTVTASYASGPIDPPGIIQIEAKDIAASAFTVQVSANGERFEPSLGSAVSSSATVEENGIWISKRGQHYAFPPLRSNSATYRVRVGVKGGDILAMAAVREAVIVFVEGEGVFKMRRTGAESWRVDQINANANLLVPGSVAVVDNQVYALTTRGLVVVDEGSVEEIDLPIKDKINALQKLSQDMLGPYSFAVGDEARLRYILYHPIAGQTGETPYATHAWVYNADNGTWTERTDASTGGMMGTDDGLLYLGAATSPVLTQERTGEPEDVFKTPSGGAIPFRLEWTVKDEGDPGTMKQFTEMRLLTEEPFTGDVTFNCTNDLGGSESTTGSTSAEGEPFIVSWVPDGCQRTTRLHIDIQRNVLEEPFSVVGLKTLVAGMYDGSMKR